MIKTFATIALIFFSATIFAADKPSSFNQNSRSGLTNSSRFGTTTRYNDGSYKNETKIGSEGDTLKIREYNAFTKQYRDGAKTYNKSGGYTTRYSDGSMESATKIGQDSLRIKQRDNYGSLREGLKTNTKYGSSANFSDKTNQSTIKYSFGSRINETGKK